MAAYWRPKLSAASRDAFTLEEITPHGEDVALDYLNFEGKPVRIIFGFDAHFYQLQIPVAEVAPEELIDCVSGLVEAIDFERGIYDMGGSVNAREDPPIFQA